MARAMQRVLPQLARLNGLPAQTEGLPLLVLPQLFQACSARGFASANLRRTPLYDLHVENGGKMVDFQGWEMPVQYKASIMDSTKHCRNSAALFDVAHMRGMTLKGPQALDFLEHITVGDFKSLQDGTGSLSLITNDRGGIVDDSVITKVKQDEVYMVLNAGCAEKDIEHIEQQEDVFKSKWQKENGSAPSFQKDVHWDRSLLALQGPAAHEILQGLVPSDFNLDKFYFGMFRRSTLKGVPTWITRTGYTGEDGFEVSVPNDKAVEVAQLLLESGQAQLTGLGARDALRLEAGLCLYGNDLNEDITPIEATLLWTIGKRRREKWDFVGGDVLKKMHAEKSNKRRRVGFISTGAPARAHSAIQTPDGQEVGEITSGAFSPCLGKNVAMGYVDKDYGKADTQLKVVVRNRTNDATVTKMPFVPCHYFRP